MLANAAVNALNTEANKFVLVAFVMVESPIIRLCPFADAKFNIFKTAFDENKFEEVALLTVELIALTLVVFKFVSLAF